VSPLRSCQRELGVPAPLDDTAEARLDRPLMTDMQLSFNERVLERLEAQRDTIADLRNEVESLKKQLKGLAAAMPVT
jgi:hypothetical protein